MRIWRGYGSNHSSMYNVVGKPTVVSQSELPEDLEELSQLVAKNGGSIEVA